MSNTRNCINKLASNSYDETKIWNIIVNTSTFIINMLYSKGDQHVRTLSNFLYNNNNRDPRGKLIMVASNVAMSIYTNQRNKAYTSNITSTCTFFNELANSKKLAWDMITDHITRGTSYSGGGTEGSLLDTKRMKPRSKMFGKSKSCKKSKSKRTKSCKKYKYKRTKSCKKI